MFKPWLIRVAFNACMSRLSAKGRSVELITSEMSDQPDEHDEEVLANLPDERQLLIAIANLKKEQRICIELFYLKKSSYQTIVQQTGFTLKQVKSYIQNGKRNLEIALKSRNGIQ
jgi:RNA polymerase sigma-70 factor (ECF subfamily)